MIPDAEVACEDCHHYRSQASFVDAYKLYDRAEPRGPIMESLKSVRKEEVELLGQEAELLFELFRAEEREWPIKPRLAPYCAAGGRVLVASVKNRARDCADFEPALSRKGRGCQTCAYAAEPESRIGDTATSLEQHDSEYWKHWMSVNKEREDAEATAQGLEIEQAFYGDGMLPVAQFLPTCSVKSTNGMRHVAPFCNLRMDCDAHRGVLPIPTSLLTTIVWRAQQPRTPDLIATTIRLARSIAETHPRAPTQFLATAGQMAGAQAWAAMCVTRWLDESSGVDPRVGVTAREQATQVLSSAGPRLFPVIAGCDAYEWGILAAMSQSQNIPAAIAFVQQVSEWYAGTFDPTERSRGVEAAIDLLSGGGFAPRTVESVDGFLRRLRASAETGLSAVREDFATHVEAMLASVSLALARDLRVTQNRREAERQRRRNGPLAGSKEQEEAEIRARGHVARERGALLLAAIESILGGSRSNDLSNLYNVVTGLEQKELVDREEEKARRQKAIVDGMTTAGGIMPVDLTGMWNILGKKANDATALLAKSTLEPRRVALAMLLYRGLSPTTPSALELLKQQPNLQRVPETVREALTEPAGRHLEALHAGRFTAPPHVLPYLQRIRRMSFPRMEGAT